MLTTKNYWEQAVPMNFESEKWSYKQKRDFRYNLQDYMFHDFNFPKWHGKKVLEIGCGSGIYAVEFALFGAKVTACDITDRAIKLTKELAKEAEVELEVVQIQENKPLPFKDDSFDCVYSYGVLHHIPNIDDMMKEIFRVLKPDGQIMAMLYNKNSLLFAYSILYLHGTQFPFIQTDDIGLRKLSSMFSERIEGSPFT